MKSIVPKEISFQCLDGMIIAAQSWQTITTTSAAVTGSITKLNIVQQEEEEQQQQEERILCLHGWMDNCRSFYKVAPTIIDHYHNNNTNKQCHVVAMDFIGHGLSTHKGIDTPPSLLADHVFYVHDIIHQLQWDSSSNATIIGSTPASSTSTSSTTGDKDYEPIITKRIEPFTIIGHSMGTGIACLYAAAFPEHVKKIILLEGVGPFARNGKDTALHIRQHIERRRLGLLQSNTIKKQPRQYSSIDKAIDARQATAKQFPGKQYISTEAAYELVLRGTKSIVPIIPTTTTTIDTFTSSSINNNNTTNTTNNDTTAGTGSSSTGVQFIHDPRLQWPSIQYLTQEQVMNIYYNIQCPVYIVLGTEGWPYTNDIYDTIINTLKPISVQKLAGSHHFHMDPNTSNDVINTIIKFLSL